MKPTTTTALLALIAVVGTTGAARADDDDDSHGYYKRTRGVGVFHRTRMVLGGLVGEAPDVMDGATPVPGATKDVTQFGVAVEGAFLGLPSSFGHFHGIEGAAGVRGAPWELWMQGGTAVTLLNLGHGGPLSLRLGGGFGAGFDFAHGYGYVRGRAALVVLPDKLDAEASVSWTPPSASTGDFDQRTMRVSVWLRAGKRSRAYEAYLESFHRLADGVDHKREVEGIGGGIGLSFL